MVRQLGDSTNGITLTNMAIVFTAPEVGTGFAGDMDMKLPNVENTVVEGALLNGTPNVEGSANNNNASKTVVEGALMNGTAGVEGLIEPNVSN